MHVYSSDNHPLRVESSDAYAGIELKDNGSSTYPPLISALSDDFIFYAGDSSSRGEVLRLTSSGNIGIGGVISPQSKIHTHIASSGGAYHQFTNSSTGSADGDGWKIGIHDDENFIIWGQESAESFRVYNNGAYRLTVDHNGAVDIPSANLYLTGSNDRRIKLSDSGIAGVSDSNNTVHIRGDNDFMKLNAAGNGGFILEVNGTENMRIASSGLSDIFSTTSTLRLRTGTTGTSGQLLSGFSGSTNNANGTQRLAIFANGNIQNTNNSYGQLSDQTLKENIVDATGKLDDLKKVKVRNFNFIGDDLKQIGVVAQELETVCPNLVDVSTEHGMKTVASSVLYMKGMKALQEAMAKIEILEAEVAALKGS